MVMGSIYKLLTGIKQVWINTFTVEQIQTVMCSFTVRFVTAQRRLCVRDVFKQTSGMSPTLTDTGCKDVCRCNCVSGWKTLLCVHLFWIYSRGFHVLTVIGLTSWIFKAYEDLVAEAVLKVERLSAKGLINKHFSLGQARRRRTATITETELHPGFVLSHIFIRNAHCSEGNRSSALKALTNVVLANICFLKVCL